MADGIVPGGGAALVSLIGTKDQVLGAMGALDADERLAVDILYRAMSAPIMQIAENAGTEGAIVLENVRDGPFGFGWNAATGVYGDLLGMGVVDPATVTVQAVLNSCSISASVITTSGVITAVKDNGADALARGPEMMGDG
jgi:chaperonin GroEL